MAGNGAALSPLRLALLLVCCCLPLLSMAAAAGESRGRSRARRGGQTQLFQVGQRTYLACTLVSEDEVDSGDNTRDGSRLGDRIASSRRTTSSSGTRRPTASRPTRGPVRQQPQQSCPSGVTFFDGCNSCSCGTEQLCTLKACNADTMVHIFDPCSRVTCGYHQRCQAICVGQVCQLRPLCVSDDSPDCHNCPWLCVDERLNCSDNFGVRACKPTLSCYKPNV